MLYTWPFQKSKLVNEHVLKLVQGQVTSKASLDKNNNSKIDNNNIYTHMPIHNKQTIKILRGFRPHFMHRLSSLGILYFSTLNKNVHNFCQVIF